VSSMSSIGKDTGNTEETNFDALVREVGGRTTRRVLAQLENQDYISSIAKDLRKAHQTIEYHIEKLQEKGLVKETGDADGRKFYKTTEKGEIVLNKINIPE
jgi:DNA-binding MarR family transcriptional regulator